MAGTATITFVDDYDQPIPDGQIQVDYVEVEVEPVTIGKVFRSLKGYGYFDNYGRYWRVALRNVCFDKESWEVFQYYCGTKAIIQIPELSTNTEVSSFLAIVHPARARVLYDVETGDVWYVANGLEFEWLKPSSASESGANG